MQKFKNSDRVKFIAKSRIIPFGAIGEITDAYSDTWVHVTFDKDLGDEWGHTIGVDPRDEIELVQPEPYVYDLRTFYPATIRPAA